MRTELEEDVRDECGKLGPLDSVKVMLVYRIWWRYMFFFSFLVISVTSILTRTFQICENHPQGVILVKYKDSKDAHKCIEVMNGRW